MNVTSVYAPSSLTHAETLIPSVGKVYGVGISATQPTVFTEALLWTSKTPLLMKNGVFWDVTKCGSCKNRHFGGTSAFITRVTRTNPQIFLQNVIFEIVSKISWPPITAAVDAIPLNNLCFAHPSLCIVSALLLLTCRVMSCVGTTSIQLHSSLVTNFSHIT
jgi:hypothetical protein